MKILLCNPPSTNELIGNDPIIIKEEQGLYPPLGILSIAGQLRRSYPSYQISVRDCQAEQLNHEEIAEIISQEKIDVVGITVMTFTIVDVKKVIDEIKKRCKAKVVVGGPHLSVYPENYRELGADYSIVGEGEESFGELLEDIVKGSDKRVYRQTKFIENLDDIPFPARDLVPTEKYFSILSHANPVTTAMSSRGCPFSCKFCDRPAMGKRFRCQSANRVVDEMEWCEKHGIKEIFYYDDTFTVKRDRVEKICSEYVRRGLSIKWDIRARVNTVDFDILKQLKECNLSRIHFGVESSVPRVLRELNKGITPDQVDRAFDACRRLGIKTLAYFMVGNPTETVDDLKDNLALIKRIRPDYLHMTILSMFPATKLYEMGKDLGLIQGDPWLDYVNNPAPDFIPPAWETIYNRKEHNKHLKKLFKSFYLRPSYIMNSLLEIRSYDQARRYFKAGMALLRMK